MTRLGLMLGVAMLGTPVLAQTTATAVPPASAPKVAAGASVTDSGGAAVGTIASVADGNATIDTGTVKAAVPVSSFGSGPAGLVLGMTKAQLEAAVAQAKPANIAVGTQVVGPKGNPVGTVSAVSGDLVTVQTPKTKVQVPKTAFAQNENGSLVIGMTVEELEGAAKAAGAPS